MQMDYNQHDFIQTYIPILLLSIDIMLLLNGDNEYIL